MAKYTLQSTVTAIAEHVSGTQKTNEMLEISIQVLRDGLPIDMPWVGGFDPSYSNQYIRVEVVGAIREIIMRDIASRQQQALDQRAQTIKGVLDVWEYEEV